MELSPQDVSAVASEQRCAELAVAHLAVTRVVVAVAVELVFAAEPVAAVVPGPDCM